MKKVTWMSRIALTAFILCISVCLTRNTFANQTLYFTASIGTPYHNADNSGFEDRLIKEVFRSLGYDVKIDFVPSERALINLDKGLDDGALARVEGVTHVYPNIIQIPEKALDREIVLFTRYSKFTPTGWDSLKPYNVAYIRGWKILENKIHSAQSITRVKDGDTLFKLLDRDHTDLIVYIRWGGLYEIQKLGLKNITLLEPPLATLPHYFLLNKKHADLAQAAAKKLESMKKDGSYQRIFDETVGTLRTRIK